MKRMVRYILLFSVLIIFSCNQSSYKTITRVDKNGFTYESVTNDPMGTRIYTLKNGLKVYLSVNTDEPRILTLISVRSGSLNDPEETTGLAHYFEHLLFKGTTKFGTSDWESEKVYIDSISQLYEQHKLAQTTEEKAAIYKQIDRISAKAAQYAIPNEYDRLGATIGASETNAFTSNETTTYINEIPSNEVRRWLEIERERFSKPVLRLFHTELETVYEEFNMYQDQDGSRLFKAFNEALFPTHPLGRDVIGYPEHLKNPSMVNIIKFFDTWYVPNNMAVILCGDLDPEETIQLVDSTFGTMPSKELPTLNYPGEKPITAPIVREVYGPDAESLLLGFRFGGEKSDDKKYVTMIDMLLSNSVAGLIDLNLVQKQKVLGAGCGTNFSHDYGFHYFIGKPRDGQTLEEVKDLLLGEIEKIKKGEFDKWLMEAIVNNIKVDMIRSTESNERAYKLFESFTMQVELADMLNFADELEKISKDELVAFANEHYNNNYVVAYKRIGDKSGIEKVEKPPITPVNINRDTMSAYLQEIVNESPESIKPVFVDYNQAIETRELIPGLTLNYIKNTTNELFEMTFIWEMGDNNDLKMALAMNYLPYLGTNRYSAEQIRKEFYRQGITMKTKVTSNMAYVTISGLEEKMLAGLELLEHLMASAQPDSIAYANLVDRIIKSRDDAKRNQSILRKAMFSYAKYGSSSPITNILTEEQLRNIDPKELTDAIAGFNTFKHRIFYYGAEMMPKIANIIERHHRIENTLLDCPEERFFPVNPLDKKNVLFLNYPKSQVEVLYLTKDIPFNRETMVIAKIFNEYYGGNMSSIVFQEIREAKALAYSTWASYVTPQKMNEDFVIQAGVFTQVDKMTDAVNAMDNLLVTMVSSQNAFNTACNNVVRSIQSERITKQSIFWSWLNNNKLGIDDDVRKDYYDAAQKLTLDDMQIFFDNHIKDKQYTYIIIGNKEDIDMKALQNIAPVQELTLESILGY